MVRNLSLNFLYSKSGTRVETESRSIELVVALASAESQKTGNTRIVSLSQISVPFWTVQTSPTKSIILSGPSSSRQQLQFSELKGAGEIKRILSSKISQAEDIPEVAAKIQPIIEKPDISSVDLSNIVNPASFASIGKYVLPTEPNAKPNRLDVQVDSNSALKRTEEYREVSESARLRIETAEELLKLVNEKFGEQYTILENLATLEQERWKERIKGIEEKTRLEVNNLTQEKEDKLYNLREKHKMNLRAMTAEFSRNVNDLEQFYMTLIEKIRDARIKIGQKEDDIEGAISIYKNLESNMKTTIDKSAQPFEKMGTKTQELQKKALQAKEEYQGKVVEIERTLESEVVKRTERVQQTKIEMENKWHEIDELKKRVHTAIERTQNTIENKIMKHKEEYLNILSWTIDNESFRDLAPLTLLDVNVYIAKYDNGSYQIFSPGFIPEGGISITTKASPVEREFHDYLKVLLGGWMKSDKSFKTTFDRTCIKGNMLLSLESDKLLSEGIDALSRRHFLASDDKERFIALWNRYAGRCPKCSASVESGARFCQKCGLDLS